MSGSAGGASVGGVVSVGNVVADASIDAAVEPEVDDGLELHAIKLMDNTAMAQRDFICVTVVGASAVALDGGVNFASFRQLRECRRPTTVCAARDSLGEQHAGNGPGGDVLRCENLALRLVVVHVGSERDDIAVVFGS